MKLALFQMEISHDLEENLHKSLGAIKEAAEHGAELILFPELQFTPFFPQFEKKDVSHFRMKLDNPFVGEIRKMCKENHIYAAPNIYLDENGKMYDATLLIDSMGEIVGIQKMVHIAEVDKFFEQDYYTPSDEGFCVFDTEIGKIGIVVCFDRHYPESIRTEALNGAELILIPTANTEAEPAEIFEWEIRIQAFWNSVAIAMCNRTGIEDEMDFSGQSIVADSSGEILVKADKLEQIIYIDIDLNEVRNNRNTKNYTSLRRPEFYQ